MSQNLEINNATFNASDVVTEYEKMKDGLFPAEEAAFAKAIEKCPKARMLDLGVGAGRTTSYFLPKVDEYVGIDYSEEMVRRTKLKFPTAVIYQMDARLIGKAFAGKRFEIVTFSFNGIDYVDHESRLKIFRAVKSLLAPGGVFIFSTHFFEHGLEKRGFHVPALVMSLNPLRVAVRAARIGAWILKSYPKYARLRRRESVHNGYGFFNDWAHHFGLITYYVSPDEQRRQLLDSGFTEEVQIYNPFERTAGTNITTQISWLLYTVGI